MSYKKYQKYYTTNRIEQSRDKSDLQEAQKLDKIILGILIGIISILPLLTRLKVIDFASPLITQNPLQGSGNVGDVFTYYKFIFLIFSTVILLVLFMYRTFALGNPIKRSYINVLIFTLSIIITLSLFFSTNKTIALVGFYNRHEGALTYFCYLTLFFIAANLEYSKKMQHAVIFALYPVTIVNALLGVIGFYGVELINNKLVQAILFPKEISQDAITSGSRFITTINNPNYVSGLSAFLITVFMVMAILDKNKVRQIINGLFAVASFAMLLSSLSRSGFATFLLMIPLIIIILLIVKEKMKSYLKLIMQLALFVVVFVVMVSHNPKVWDESIGLIFHDNPFATEQTAFLNSESQIKLDDVSTELFSLNHKAYAETITDPTDQKSQEQFQLPQLLDPKWGPGTGRIYIWSRTLELVKDRPIVGYGFDTFIYKFPQYDPEKVGNLNDSTTIVDKPHNFYVNIAFGGGVVALITILLLIGLLLLSGLKLTYKNEMIEEYKTFFISLLMGCIAFSIQWLFNDSIIGTAPIFWILFGVFCSIVLNIEEIKNQTK